MRNRIRVVVAVHAAHVGLTPVEIKTFDLKELPLEDVDGLFVERRRPAREIGLANDALAIGAVHDHKVI
jgi:hypothetical protein